MFLSGLPCKNEDRAISGAAQAPHVKWVVSYGLNRSMVLELITGSFSCSRTLRRSINRFKRTIHCLHNMMCVNLGDARAISREVM